MKLWPCGESGLFRATIGDVRCNNKKSMRTNGIQVNNQSFIDLLPERILTNIEMTI